VADDTPLVRGRQRRAVDDQRAVLLEEPAGRHDAHAGQLDRLGTGVAQLLEHVHHLLRGERRRACDRDDDARSLDRRGAREDPLHLEVVLGGAARVGAAQQGGAVLAQLARLLRQRLVALRDLVEQPDEVVLAQARELVALRLPHLDDDREPQQQAQRRHQQLAAPAAAAVPGRLARSGAALPTGSGSGRRRLHRPGERLRALLLAHALRRCRRIEAALEKIRMPSTTTTAVLSCAPTPSWSPRNTMKAATSTLNRNEVTNTRSSNFCSSR